MLIVFLTWYIYCIIFYRFTLHTCDILNCYSVIVFLFNSNSIPHLIHILYIFSRFPLHICDISSCYSVMVLLINCNSIPHLIRILHNFLVSLCIYWIISNTYWLYLIYIITELSNGWPLCQRPYVVLMEVSQTMYSRLNKRFFLSKSCKLMVGPLFTTLPQH